MGRSSRRENILQARLHEKEREMKIQERENEMINSLKERMERLVNREDGNMDYAQRRLLIEGLEHRIKRIQDRRAERALRAEEMEVKRQQLLLEEATTMQEPPPEEDVQEANEDEEEREERGRRAFTKGLVKLAVNFESISNLRQSAATMRLRAGMLRRVMEGENSNTVKTGNIMGSSPIPIETIHTVQSGFTIDGDFRQQELSQLMEGISRTEAAIKSAVSQAYKNTAYLQEGQLALYRKEDDEESEDSFDENV